MTFTEAGHRGAIKMFWLCILGDSMLLWLRPPQHVNHPLVTPVAVKCQGDMDSLSFRGILIQPFLAGVAPSHTQQEKATPGAEDGADLCTVCDGVSLLGAEVTQDVCRLPLTRVMNPWTPYGEKPYHIFRPVSDSSD